MNKQNIILVFSVIFFACNNALKNRSSEIANRQQALQYSGKDTSLRQCILENDTLLNEDNFIKYVIIDSFYTLKIRVGGIDTLLPYKFNCSVPRSLVPAFHSFYRNTFSLIRGAGQNYREYIICYTDNNHIVIKKYEIALAIDLENDIVAYQNYDSLQIVNVENIRTKSKKIFTIPSNFLSNTISEAAFKNQKLTLVFLDGKKIHFSL